MSLDRRDVLALSKALAVSGLLAGCTGTESAPGTTANPEKTVRRTTIPVATDETDDAPQSPTEAVIAGNTAFALDLLDRLAGEADDPNVFVSPYSVSTALAMTYAGARGSTKIQMRETLHFPRNSVHAAFRRLREQFAAYDAPETTTGGTENGGDDATAETETTPAYREATPFELSTANALWGQEGFPFRESFLELLDRNYGAGLRCVDFASNPEAARRTVNDWVAERTQGKIRDLLARGVVSTATRLILTNAVYFRANWKTQFAAENTEDGTFAALDGTEATVPLMSQREIFPYASADGHQLIELPYAGEQVGMVVVLPAEGEFERFRRSLSGDRLSELVGSLEPREGSITLPRFEYRSKFALWEVLSDLGMAAAFGAGANFSGMTDGEGDNSLGIDDVIHQSFVSVDEQGTEAAAATAVVADTAAQTSTGEPFEMVVDRPFLFFIRDRETGTLLFAGQVADAGAAQSSE
ncbi:MULTISPECIES: serpin family protein [Halorussus]|uniref:serpin family protein n=1 Tax=Halorussus TaxID=1070314 RepID=UPI0020A17859|nr:serpin family protein [Halorussus vallis]USZ75179.1 serpin family protein [Halorussus vallis]